MERMSLVILRDIYGETDLLEQSEDNHLLGLKRKALTRIYDRMCEYADCGIRVDVILTIFSQKIVFLREARTEKQIENIVRPAKPQVKPVRQIPYQIEAEEMVQWTILWLRGFLPPVAEERYKTLYAQYICPD